MNAWIHHIYIQDPMCNSNLCTLFHLFSLLSTIQENQSLVRLQKSSARYYNDNRNEKTPRCKMISFVIPQSVTCQLLVRSSDYASFPPDHHALTHWTSSSIFDKCLLPQTDPRMHIKGELNSSRDRPVMSEWTQMIYSDIVGHNIFVSCSVLCTVMKLWFRSREGVSS